MSAGLASGAFILKEGAWVRGALGGKKKKNQHAELASLFVCFFKQVWFQKADLEQKLVNISKRSTKNNICDMNLKAFNVSKHGSLNKIHPSTQSVMMLLSGNLTQDYGTEPSSFMLGETGNVCTLD